MSEKVSVIDSDVQTDKTAVIAASGTKSAEVDLRGTTLVGVTIPSGFVGTALTFEVATETGGTFIEVWDGATGAAISKTVAASKYIALIPSEMAGLRFIKLVSGSTETSGATITLHTRAT